MTSADEPGKDPMEALDAWIQQLCAAVDLDPGLVDRDAVLGLAGVAAHAVVRPAAPVTTYVVGLLVGADLARGADPEDAHRRAVAAVSTVLAGRVGP